MDIKPQTTQPISDDQDLAKVLAGVSNGASATSAQPAAQLPPRLICRQSQRRSQNQWHSQSQLKRQTQLCQQSTVILIASRTKPSKSFDRWLTSSTSLPKKKFDTYLLLIRSTDDKTLIAPAHEAAKNIADESRRAQALLDVIKEIDFLSNTQP